MKVLDVSLFIQWIMWNGIRALDEILIRSSIQHQTTSVYHSAAISSFFFSKNWTALVISNDGFAVFLWLLILTPICQTTCHAEVFIPFDQFSPIWCCASCPFFANTALCNARQKVPLFCLIWPENLCAHVCCFPICQWSLTLVLRAYCPVSLPRCSIPDVI